MVEEATAVVGGTKSMARWRPWGGHAMVVGAPWRGVHGKGAVGADVEWLRYRKELALAVRLESSKSASKNSKWPEGWPSHLPTSKGCAAPPSLFREIFASGASARKYEARRYLAQVDCAEGAAARKELTLDQAVAQCQDMVGIGSGK